jgi:hypothetical protein
MWADTSIVVQRAASIESTATLAAVARLPEKRRRLEDLDASEQCEVLLGLVGRGSSHVATVAAVAVATERDHGIHTAPAVRALASLGSHGRWPANAERDLHRWTRDLWRYGLRLSEVPVTLHTGDQKTPGKTMLPVLAPDVLIRALLEAGPLQRTVSLTGSDGEAGLEAFWEQALKQPCCWHLESILAGRNRRRCIPMVWHEDGAELFRNSEYYIWSWRSASVDLSVCPSAPWPHGAAELRRQSECLRPS